MCPAPPSILRIKQKPKCHPGLFPFFAPHSPPVIKSYWFITKTEFKSAHAPPPAPLALPETPAGSSGSGPPSHPVSSPIRSTSHGRELSELDCPVTPPLQKLVSGPPHPQNEVQASHHGHQGHVTWPLDDRPVTTSLRASRSSRALCWGSPRSRRGDKDLGSNRSFAMIPGNNAREWELIKYLNK